MGGRSPRFYRRVDTVGATSDIQSRQTILLAVPTGSFTRGTCFDVGMTLCWPPMLSRTYSIFIIVCSHSVAMLLEQPVWGIWRPLESDDLVRMGCPLQNAGCCILCDWTLHHSCPACLGDWVCEPCMIAYELCEPGLDWDLLGWSSGEDNGEESTTRVPSVSDTSVATSVEDCDWLSNVLDNSHDSSESGGSTLDAGSTPCWRPDPY